MILGSLAGQFSGDHWKHGPRWLGFLAGGVWHAPPAGDSWVDQSSLIVTSLRRLAVVIWQLALFHLLLSDQVLTAFQNTSSR